MFDLNGVTTDWTTQLSSAPTHQLQRRYTNPQANHHSYTHPDDGRGHGGVQHGGQEHHIVERGAGQ